MISSMTTAYYDDYWRMVCAMSGTTTTTMTTMRLTTMAAISWRSSFSAYAVDYPRLDRRRLLIHSCCSLPTNRRSHLALASTLANHGDVMPISMTTIWSFECDCCDTATDVGRSFAAIALCWHYGTNLSVRECRQIRSV